MNLVERFHAYIEAQAARYLSKRGYAAPYKKQGIDAERKQ